MFASHRLVMRACSPMAVQCIREFSGGQIVVLATLFHDVAQRKRFDRSQIREHPREGCLLALASPATNCQSCCRRQHPAALPHRAPAPRATLGLDSKAFPRDPNAVFPLFFRSSRASRIHMCVPHDMACRMALLHGTRPFRL